MQNEKAMVFHRPFVFFKIKDLHARAIAHVASVF